MTRRLSSNLDSPLLVWGKPMTRRSKANLPVNTDLGIARRASKGLSPPSAASRGLQDRLLALLVAGCAKPMRWFGAAHGFFYNVSESARTDLGKCVPLLFCRPCFK